MSQATSPKYGFTVGVDGWMSNNGPNDGHVFTNDGHYTSAMQDIFAEITAAQLKAREQFGHLLTQPMLAMRQETATLEPRLGPSAFLPTGAAHARERAQGEWRTYSDITFDLLQTHAAGGFNTGLDADSSGGSAGANVALTKGLVVGGQLGYREEEGAFGGRTGAFSRDLLLVTAYATSQLDNDLFVNAAASYGHLDYGDITRKAQIGPARETASGETSGAYWSARLGLGHSFAAGDWLLSTHSALSYERSEIDGYRERGAVLGIAYGDSNFEALHASLGLNAELALGDYRFRPFAGISVEHDLLDDDAIARMGPNSAMLVDYAFERPERTVARGSLGGRYQLMDGIDVHAMVSVDWPVAADTDVSVAGRIGLTVSK